jgi:hypothetical protein
MWLWLRIWLQITCDATLAAPALAAPVVPTPISVADPDDYWPDPDDYWPYPDPTFENVLIRIQT